MDFTKYMEKNVEIPPMELTQIAEIKIDRTRKVVENKPTHPVKLKMPEYRKWKNKKGARVFQVQYRQILDLTKPIIKKTTLSKDEIPKNSAQKQMKTMRKRYSCCYKDVIIVR